MPAKRRRHSVSGQAAGSKAKPVWCDGHRFPSEKERDRYLMLKLLQRAGEISDLKIQPRFPLHIDGKPVFLYPKVKGARQVCWFADFQYIEKTPSGTYRTIVEDTKGAWTDVARLKVALVACLYDVDIRIT